ncbi:MAG TPA: CapA family protein [Methylomirabilota bacterium]|nr:CapA family protein [Methylomirabilota bacterium]
MNPAGNITLAFLGDLTLGCEFATYASRRAVRVPDLFQAVLPLINQADLRVINLEGPIGRAGTPRAGRGAVLWNEESVLELLDRCRPCVVSLANNHTMDFGEPGLERTLRLLSKHGIDAVGAGADAAAANAGRRVQMKGSWVTFFSWTTDEPAVGSVLARAAEAGCGSFLDLERAEAQVRAARAAGDFVCVLLHWGREFFEYPSPEQRHVARRLVGAGAGLIVGHHAHVLQGVERHGTGLILYGVGNFFAPPLRHRNGRPRYQKPVERRFALATIEVAAGCATLAGMTGGRRGRDYVMRLDPGRGVEDEVMRLSGPLQCADYDNFWDGYSTRRQRQLRLERWLETPFRLGLVLSDRIVRSSTAAFLS